MHPELVPKHPAHLCVCVCVCVFVCVCVCVCVCVRAGRHQVHELLLLTVLYIASPLNQSPSHNCSPPTICPAITIMHCSPPSLSSATTTCTITATILHTLLPFYPPTPKHQFLPSHSLPSCIHHHLSQPCAVLIPSPFRSHILLHVHAPPSP